MGLCELQLTMKKILFINKTHPVLRSALESWGYTCEEDLNCDVAALRQKIPAYEGLVLRSRLPVDAELLRLARKLRFVAREGIGLEHIDVEAAKALGIAVLNSPEGSRDAVGEHALGMLLALLNKLCKADREVRRGLWLREENRARELGELCVGILGYGNTGKAFARKLSGLGSVVLAYDKYLSDYGDGYAQQVNLEEFFARVDVLSIHIPGEERNRHFVDAAFLDAFARPIYLLNTARGMVLDTEALLERLRSGKVLAAGLDVLEYETPSLEMPAERLEEPLVKALRQMDNVLLTPHVAGWSFASKRKHAEVLVKKIKSLILQV